MKNEADTSRHHRRPKSIGGSNEPPNVVRVPNHKHQAWHVLFSNMTAQQILEQINDWWLDPKYALCLVPRVPPVDADY